MWRIYENLHLFATKYRGYTVTSPVLAESAFTRQIQGDRRVRIEATAAAPERKITIVLLAKNNKTHVVVDLRDMLTEITKGERRSADVARVVMFISDENLKAQLVKVSLAMPTVRLYNYLHIHFLIELPRVLHATPHRIIGDAEKKLLEENHVRPESLPHIRENDAQCVWIGAQVGDIVAVERKSLGSGCMLRYRRVVPAA
jgi:DNA-directed RNA polymerase subunit H (RpoH/RPB5)